MADSFGPMRDEDADDGVVGAVPDASTNQGGKRALMRR